MIPATIATHNPFEGLSVEGVRHSFEDRPVRSFVAAAAFGCSLMWALKATRKNSAVGALAKGMIAMAVMKRAKNVFVNGHYRDRSRQIEAV